MSNAAAHAELQKIQRRIRGLTGAPEKAAEVLAPRFEGEIHATFAEKTDLYGAGWKGIQPATTKRGSQSALVRTGKLSRDLFVEQVGSKIRCRFSVFYARYHITTGRGTLPRRGEFPPKWAVQVKAETEAAFKRLAEGR